MKRALVEIALSGAHGLQTGYTLTARPVRLHSQRSATRYELHDGRDLVTSIALGTKNDADWLKVRMGSFPPPFPNYWCAEEIATGATLPKKWDDWVHALAWAVLIP